MMNMLTSFPPMVFTFESAGETLSIGICMLSSNPAASAEARFIFFPGVYSTPCFITLWVRPSTISSLRPETLTESCGIESGVWAADENADIRKKRMREGTVG